MKYVTRLSVTTIAVVLGSALSGASLAQDKAAPKSSHKGMSFFVTSVGSGKGADLGGLEGADKHCQELAASVGAGNRTWHAYLSAVRTETSKVVNARDRIGKGPWYNAKGVLIARNVDDLQDNANITKQTALTEKGAIVNGRGDRPNMHDMLTGSDSQGRAHPVLDDTTCRNWTSSTDGSATLGHADRTGLDEKAASKSWVMAHPSAGCSQDALRRTGGNGLFYCFAAK